MINGVPRAMRTGCRWRRIATRYEKRQTDYQGTLTIATSLLRL